MKEKKIKQKTKGNWFNAQVLVCFDDGNSCEEISDTRGPYETQKKCYERAIEMVADIRELLGEGDFSYKCEHSV